MLSYILAILYLITAMRECVKVVSFETLHSFKRWCGEECTADLVVIKPEKSWIMDEEEDS